MVVSACDSGTQEAEAGEQFDTSLGCITSWRSNWATWLNPVSKTKQNKKKKKKGICLPFRNLEKSINGEVKRYSLRHSNGQVREGSY
jgi:hypothetical protein